MPHHFLVKASILPELLQEKDRPVKFVEIENAEVVAAQDAEPVSCLGVREPAVLDCGAALRHFAVFRAVGFDSVDEVILALPVIEFNGFRKGSHLLLVDADAEFELAWVEMVFDARPVFVWHPLPRSDSIVEFLNVELVGHHDVYAN